MNNTDRIKRLLDEYLALMQSEENQRRKRKWERLDRIGRDQIRIVPKMDGSWRSGNIPITVDFQPSFWAEYFQFSLKDFYLDAPTFVENFLKIRIERFRLIQDDTFLDDTIPMWGSTVFEGSWLGQGAHFFDRVDPWFDHAPTITSEKDFHRIEDADFYKSGFMPQFIKTYEQSCGLAGSSLEVLFPMFERSTVALAMYLYGFENMLTELCADPDFCIALMESINDARKRWYTECEKYLGRKIERADLFNDEVNIPNLSPGIYRDLVLPFEIDLCNFHGGFHYWHSCGNTGPLMREISKIPIIGMIHCGPWTSPKMAGDAFGKRAPLEICMNPQKHLLEADPVQMRRHLTDLISEIRQTDIAGFTFRANTLARLNSAEETLGKAREWISAARGVADDVARGAV